MDNDCENKLCIGKLDVSKKKEWIYVIQQDPKFTA